jgi:hypothetical protein
MYGWLWRTFPGGRIGKVLCSVLLAAVAIGVLFVVVFPRVEPLLPFQDVNVDTGSTSEPSPTAGP